MRFRSGRHFLQLPGPTNVPDRILRAMSRPPIDHRGPAFAEMGLRILSGLKQVFGASEHVFVYPASGSGAWEAALVNTLSPGDRVVRFDNGHFIETWGAVAQAVGLAVNVLPSDWRRPVDAAALEAHLGSDKDHEIKAVLVVQNETSTGVMSDIPGVRAAIDRADHPALLLVDAVSSLCAMELLHDEWGVDVTISGSQKGLMLPPGLGFHLFLPGFIFDELDLGPQGFGFFGLPLFFEDVRLQGERFLIVFLSGQGLIHLGQGVIHLSSIQQLIAFFPQHLHLFDYLAMGFHMIFSGSIQKFGIPAAFFQTCSLGDSCEKKDLADHGGKGAHAKRFTVILKPRVGEGNAQ